MKYVGKQKAKVDLRTKRFRVVRCPEANNCLAIVDRDAVPLYQVADVARVTRPYARALCALMNADQEVFPLVPRRNRATKR